MIKNSDEIAKTERRRKAVSILDVGLNAIKTETVLGQRLEVEKESLRISGENIRSKEEIELSQYNNIAVIGIGKASAGMAAALENELGGRIDQGIVTSTETRELDSVDVLEGDHPLPSERNVENTEKIVDLLKSLSDTDLVLSLISGGGSALLCSPKIGFEEYRMKMEEYLDSGKDIYELNRLRKDLSNVKAGKLAEKTDADIVSLIFSDVVGDDLSAVASGPTVKPGKSDADSVKNILLLNNEVALEAMEEEARSLGLQPVIITDTLEGRSEKAVERIFDEVSEYSDKDCFLFAGETTVNVTGGGRGGRNQELCLAAVSKIKEMGDAAMVSVDTDGIDGNTNAAGAVVDSETFERAKKKGINHEEFLEDNDSNSFFRRLDDVVITGETGSNVADIGILLAR